MISAPTLSPRRPVFFRAGARRGLVLLCLVGLGLVGCSSPKRLVPERLKVSADRFQIYQPDVIQGNFVSREQRAALRLGMPRAQVLAILGNPFVASVFHAARWDYAFTIRRQGVPDQKFLLTVHFEDDRLARIEGDELPSEAEFAQRLSERASKAPVVPRLEATETELRKFPAPQAPAAAAPAAATLPSQYPPLEPAAR